MRSLLFVALISIVGEAWAQHGNVQNIGSEVVLEEDTTFSVFFGFLKDLDFLPQSEYFLMNRVLANMLRVFPKDGMENYSGKVYMQNAKKKGVRRSG
jgi:hypothetical protein